MPSATAPSCLPVPDFPRLEPGHGLVEPGFQRHGATTVLARWLVRDAGCLHPMLARRRLERGVKLNYPEAVTLISDFVMEGARDGRAVADLMRAGAELSTRAQVMEDIPEMIHDVQVEAAFPDGTRLVSVHQLIR